MDILIYDIIIDDKKVDNICFNGVDIDMSDNLIYRICQQNIKQKYNVEAQNFKWRWNNEN